MPDNKAMEILTALHDKLQQRRQHEQEQKAQEEQTKYGDAQPMALEGKVYICFDADNLGNKIAIAEERDDERLLADLSARINSGQDLFKQWLTNFGGKLTEAGGDEGLGQAPMDAVRNIESFRDQYLKLVGATVTVGIGNKISEATKARELGKLRGKNQVVQFFDGLEKELQARLADEGEQDEASKMRSAGLGGGQDAQQEPQEAQDEPQGSQDQEEPAREPESAQEEYEQQNPETIDETKENQQPTESKEESPKRETIKKTASGLDPRVSERARQLHLESKKKVSLKKSDRFYDQEIEHGDYSQDEDPELVKRLRYLVKYGRD